MTSDSTSDDTKKARKYNKKRDFSKWSVKYKPKYDNLMYDLACQGKTLTQIAQILEVDVDALRKWSEDGKKKSFQRAYKASQQAFQAYHEDLYQQMRERAIKGVTAAEIQAQRDFLKTMCAEDWSKPEKRELEVTNKTDTMSETELNARLERLLNSDSTRNYMREIVEKGFKPNLKAVSKDDKKNREET